MDWRQTFRFSCLFYGSLFRWLIHPVILFLQHVDERPANAFDQLLHLTHKLTLVTGGNRKLKRMISEVLHPGADSEDILEQGLSWSLV